MTQLIGRPTVADIFCAMARATVSTAVPACSGTSIVIGRDGKVMGRLGEQVPFNLEDQVKAEKGVEDLLAAK